MKLYKKIFITFGNHDMYLISNSQVSNYKLSWNRVLELKQICDDIDTVEFLDGNIVEVDGIKIGGIGGWYDFSYGKKVFNMNSVQMLQRWKEVMTDADRIIGNDRGMGLNDTRAMYGYGKMKMYNFDPVLFFNSEFKKYVSIIDKCDIFVSHVGPVVPPNLKTEYQEPNTGFYYFDGTWQLEQAKAPKLCIFGHTHDRLDFKFNNSWMMCNPLGYKSENTGAEIAVVDLFDLDLD